eukprot:TRINITY_DN9481_c0_g1_i1.p1 TRINITY_DN9481_c0_g1~~TRINITY_DN9481_c0_g1_i1.p1  ORF type:complete len:422 (+),score=64.42 TRINITY_DN9481_c0_g1_i1:112-1377(+)
MATTAIVVGASDAVGGGVCQPMDGSSHSRVGCPDKGDSRMWNMACCSQKNDCASCNLDLNDGCQWCESGSKVNGGKCLPFDSNMGPTLGGCDIDFWSRSCCRKHGSCQDCSSGSVRYDCGWCGEKSAMNPGQCLPRDANMGPKSGGCSAGNWSQPCASTGCPANCKDQLPGSTSCSKEGVCSNCKVGFYGTTCEKSCSSTCLTGCDQTTGECYGCTENNCVFSCEQKCNPMLGCRTCDQSCQGCTTCPDGSWGLGKDRCKNFCRNCIGFQCDDKDGTCGKGCLQGWSGQKCDVKCAATCSAPQVCIGGECECQPGYANSALGCYKLPLGIDCDRCNQLAGSAKLALQIAKRYSTYEDALDALKGLTCFFLPPPVDLGCAAAVTTDAVGAFIISQVSDSLQAADFCIAWGACKATEKLQTVI